MTRTTMNIAVAAAFFCVLLYGPAAQAAIINSNADNGAWMDGTTWVGGVAPIAGDTNTWRLVHQRMTNAGNDTFLGDTLVITSGNKIGLMRTLAGSTDWNMNNVIVETGANLFDGSANRHNDIHGEKITLEDGAIINGVGRSPMDHNFDEWVVASTDTVLFRSSNTELEIGDGPGAGTTDMTGFEGTLKLINYQGVDRVDLFFSFDIPVADASIKMLISDTDVGAGQRPLGTIFELRNGKHQAFASIDVHRVRLTTDVDNDNRYDPADGDVLLTEDISIPAGTYTQAQLVTLDARLADVFWDQGAGTGTITVADAGGTGDIPEPATMALLGLAVCGLGGYVRKRRRA